MPESVKMKLPRFFKRNDCNWCGSTFRAACPSCGGACWGCGLWIQYTPYTWEIDKKMKYALVVGNSPRLPEAFEEDEVIVMGKCALRSHPSE